MPMAMGSVEPWTNVLRLDESSSLRTHRYSDRFSVVRVETTGPLPDAVHKSSSVPALLVSTFVRPVEAPNYRLWVDGKAVPTGPIPAFRANVVDLAGEPAMWGGPGVDYVHFHVRRGAIDETAGVLGYDRIGEIRVAIAQEDLVLAQLTKTIVPFLGSGAAQPPLALDHLELILAAHVVQRYGSATRPRAAIRGGLAAWQRRQVAEMLRENLDGRIRLAALAGTCDLSVSHFARAFKASFGVTCHRWLTERRIERAQELLAQTRLSLQEIGNRSGFADQAAFTRVFRRSVGVPPGLWRRENAKLPRR
jgi:AraC family transcriptional regulator